MLQTSICSLQHRASFRRSEEEVGERDQSERTELVGWDGREERTKRAISNRFCSRESG
jgi:hypothetical protein